jgi:hypothetical protein
LYPRFVHAASGDISDTISRDPKRWPAFEHCVGALDGTHLRVHVPADRQSAYRNRHGDLTQNVLAVVNFEMNFTFVLAGWEGSAHDGRVLADAISRGFKAPEGRYFLADAGYSNSELTLSPYRGVRYHLREVRAVGKAPEDKKELFNLRHSSLRNVVERTFGVWKRRWRVFDRPHEFKLPTQVKLVYALVVVHNLINSYYGVEEDFDRFEPAEGEQSARVKREDDGSSDALDERRERIANMLWKNYCEAWGRPYEA